MISSPTTLLGILGIVLSLPAWALFLRGLWRLWRFVSQGTSSEPERFHHLPKRFVRMLVEVFGHTRMKGKPLVLIAHWAVMVGFLFGVVVWFESYIQTFWPAGGWPFLRTWTFYHGVEELLAIFTVLGILTLIVVRLRLGHKDRSSRFYGSQAWAARAIEAIVFLEGLGMLLVKAAKIATYGHAHPIADLLSAQIARLLPESPVLISCFALLKLLAGMAFLSLVGLNLTWGVAWHRILAFFNIFFKRDDGGLGALPALRTAEGEVLTLENVGEDDQLGAGRLEDLSWKMRLDAATCTECGRCQDLCPAWQTEKPLSPKLLMMDIREAALNPQSAAEINDVALNVDNPHAGVDVLKLAGDIVTDDVLWSCTNCGACVDQCPVDIEHIDHVAALRRFRVLSDSEFPGELGTMFRALETKGNPWGRNRKEREDWITAARRDGLEVPIFGEDVDSFADLEYLFWVGCAGAFDEEGVKTTRAVVELLHTAGVKFAVLSKGETCTGDPARRAGNEFLFQMLAAENIETLNNTFEGVPAGQRKIITTCPHCFNTFRREYPDFDGHFDVFHHTQLLNRLVREKRLTPIPRGPENRRPITYHDPCFLGRHNQVFDPPRELIGATGASISEMPHSHNEAFCCGAGGARMFMEEKLGTRINEFRTKEALDTGAETIVVGCPFCNTMMSGGVRALRDDQPKDQRPQVRDVAQMLRDSILVDGQLPTPHPPDFLDKPTRDSAPKKPTALPMPGLGPEGGTPTTKDAATDKKAPGASPRTSTPLPTPGAAVPSPGSATPTPIKRESPSDSALTGKPGVPRVPTPDGVPAPGGISTPGGVPTPGAATPKPVAPKPMAPKPAASKPAAPTPTVPKASAPTPPVPGAATPPPAAPKPAAPKAAAPKPGVPKPGVPTPAAPGASAPKPVTPKPMAPKPVVPSPSAPAPSAPTPGAGVPAPVTPKPVAPKPVAPQPSTPTPAVPGAATPKPAAPKPVAPQPAAPKPSVPTPTVPKPASATSKVPTPSPAAPKPTTPKPTVPSPSVPKPAAATPKPSVPKPQTPKPAAPGSAVPTPGAAVPPPGAANPAAPKPVAKPAEDSESNSD